MLDFTSLWIDSLCLLSHCFASWGLALHFTVPLHMVLHCSLSHCFVLLSIALLGAVWCYFTLHCTLICLPWKGFNFSALHCSTQLRFELRCFVVLCTEALSIVSLCTSWCCFALLCSAFIWTDLLCAALHDFALLGCMMLDFVLRCCAAYCWDSSCTALHCCPFLRCFLWRRIALLCILPSAYLWITALLWNALWGLASFCTASRLFVLDNFLLHCFMLLCSAFLALLRVGWDCFALLRFTLQCLPLLCFPLLCCFALPGFALQFTLVCTMYCLKLRGSALFRRALLCIALYKSGIGWKGKGFQKEAVGKHVWPKHIQIRQSSSVTCFRRSRKGCKGYAETLIWGPESPRHGTHQAINLHQKVSTKHMCFLSKKDHDALRLTRERSDTHQVP